MFLDAWRSLIGVYSSFANDYEYVFACVFAICCILFVFKLLHIFFSKIF